MRRAAAIAVVALIALAGAANAKPTCVVIHALGHHALVRHVADTVRARLARSHSFVLGTGQKERSFHVTIRYGAMRMPKGVEQPVRGRANINVSFEYRTQGPTSPGFEGMTVIQLYCADAAIAACADTIVQFAYMNRNIEREMSASSGPWPMCFRKFRSRCTSSAF